MAAPTPISCASPTNDAATAACDIGDLHIVASSPGGWASGYSVRLTRRPDDATRFKLEVILPANNNAVLETVREPVDGSRRSRALRRR